MSRPPYLRDILCHTNIPNLPGRNTSDILTLTSMRVQNKFLNDRQKSIRKLPISSINHTTQTLIQADLPIMSHQHP
jgi:hypothetical protein